MSQNQLIIQIEKNLIICEKMKDSSDSELDDEREKSLIGKDTNIE